MTEFEMEMLKLLYSYKQSMRDGGNRGFDALDDPYWRDQIIQQCLSSGDNPVLHLVFNRLNVPEGLTVKEKLALLQLEA